MFVVMMHQCSPGELLTSAALVHHADSLGVSQPHRVSSAAFMHHDDQRYDALRCHATHKGVSLRQCATVCWERHIVLLGLHSLFIR